MKNKTLAIFGIGTYILSVVSSATDSTGNSVVPAALIVVSALATLVFIVMATIRLWKPAKALAITFVVSSVILSISSFGEIVFSSYGSTTILFLNLVKIVAFISAILVVIKLFKMDDADLVHQQAIAEKLYRENPDLAMRIAKGEEQAPSGVLAAAVYAKVCDEAEKSYAKTNDEAEKSEHLNTIMQLGNSHRNTKFSAESQRLKLRDSLQAVEAIKQVVNARRKAFEKTLPKGKTYEMVIDEEVENIRKTVKESRSTKEEWIEFAKSLGEKEG